MSEVLVSVHFPLTDLRSFVAGELGRIPNFGTGNHVSENRFFRSAGLRQFRPLGPGDKFINEAAFFDIRRIIKLRNSSNLPQSGNHIPRNIFTRLYALDEVCLRADVGVVLSQSTKKRAIVLEEIIQFASNLNVKCLNDFAGAERRVFDSGPLFARLVQSRTTTERFAKRKLDFDGLKAGDPILFIEAFEDEISVNRRAQEMPLRGNNDHIKLFHFYPRNNLRGWIIVKSRMCNRADLQNARLLRMYLSRLYVHAASFRALARGITRLDEILDEEVLPEAYGGYIRRNRRFIASLSKDISDLTGHEYGALAVLAHNMIRPNEMNDIITAHERVISLQQIFQNFRNDLSREITTSNAFNEGTPGNFVTNYIFNLFGSMNAVRQSATVPLAKPQVRIELLLPKLQKFSTFISIFGTDLTESRFLTIERHLKEIEDHATKGGENGPMMLSHLDELEKACRAISNKRSQEQAQKYISEIREEIII